MRILTIDELVKAVNKSDPGLLGAYGASHEIKDGRIHLISRDDFESRTEVWIYQNAEGKFVYDRGGEISIRNSVDDVIEAVFGNDPGASAEEY